MLEGIECIVNGCLMNREMVIRSNRAGNALLVSAPEDAREELNSIPNGEWSVSGKRICIPYSLGWMVRELFSEKYYIKCEDDEAYESLTREAPKEIELPDDYVFVNKPGRHQLMDFMRFRNGEVKMWHLGYDQGTGKTFSALTISDYIATKEGYGNTLIITGVNSVKWQWLDQIAEHTTRKGIVLGSRRGKNGKWKNTGGPEKLEDLDNGKLLAQNHYLVTNIESLRDEKLVKKLIKMINSGRIGFCIVDESHKMKNPTAQQTKGVFKLNPPYKLTLSGTPMVNSPLDLYSTMKWLGAEEHTWTAFKNHYCMYHEYMRGRITGYRHVDELREAFGKIQTRVLKEDVLDLPEKTHQVDYIEMGVGQRKLYNDILKQTLEEIDKIEGNLNPMTLTLRLRQFNNCPDTLTSTKVGNCKLERLRERLQEAMEAGTQVLVFSLLKDGLRRYYEELKDEFNIGLITGDVKPEDREDLKNKFKSGEIRVLLGTTGTMGTGLDIGTAELVIFIDEPWTKADKVQCEDRAHRRGITKAVNVVTFRTLDSVDEVINDIVEGKGILSDYIVDKKPIPKEVLVKALSGGMR